MKTSMSIVRKSTAFSIASVTFVALVTLIVVKRVARLMYSVIA